MNRRMMAICFLTATLLPNMCGCAGDELKISATVNQSASLVGELPANPLQWRVITSSVNKENSTMSTLYGNDFALQYARTNSQHNYPSGAALSLVTWTERDNDRWFGARIPDRVRSVEFVFVGVAVDGRPSYSYQEYEGAPLKKLSGQESSTPNERAAYLLSQRAAVMP